jgi:hypothetical protein
LLCWYTTVEVSDDGVAVPIPHAVQGCAVSLTGSPHLAAP